MLSIAGWIAAAAVSVGIYRNVIVDDSDLQDRTSELARQHAGCGDRCRVTRIQTRRSLLGYHAEMEIDGAGTFAVSCSRAAIIAGAQSCTAQAVSAR